MTAVGVLIVVLGAILSTATNLGTGLPLPASWTWARNPVLVWSIVAAAVLTSAALAVVQGRLDKAKPDTAVEEDLAVAVATLLARDFADSRNDVPLRWGTTDWSTVDGLPAAGLVDGLGDLTRRMRELRRPVQLVVLGDQGGGKTTGAARLALDLLRRHVDRDPIPLLLHLGSWDPGQDHLHAWVARRTVEDYLDPTGSPHDAKIVAALLVRQDVLPILDGFDELPKAKLDAAVIAINQILAQGGSLVLLSRPDTYLEAVSQAERLAGHPLVIKIEPAEAGEVAAYLLAGSAEEQARWRPVVKRLTTQPDSVLAQALGSPLMVAMASSAYRDPAADPTELLAFRRTGDLEEHLLGAFVDKAYAPPRPPPPGAPAVRPRMRCEPAKARRWLGTVAGLTRDRSGAEIYWWELGDDLPVYTVLGCLLVTAVVGVVVGLGLDVQCSGEWVTNVTPNGGGGTSCAGTTTFAVVDRGPWSTVAHVVPAVIGAGIGTAFIAALLGTEMADRPARLRLGPMTLAKAAMRLLPVILGGLVVACCVGLLNKAGNHMAVALQGERFRTPYGVPDVVSVVLAVAIFFGGSNLSSAGKQIHSYSGPEDPVSPARTLRTDRRAALVEGSVSWFALTIVALTLGHLTVFGHLRGLALAAVAGFAGFLLALQRRAWGGWLLFKLVHAVRGDLPWRLARFLDDARRRGVLRQAGPGYHFRHLRLRDHLARRRRSVP